MRTPKPQLKPIPQNEDKKFNPKSSKPNRILGEHLDTMLEALDIQVVNTIKYLQMTYPYSHVLCSEPTISKIADQLMIMAITCYLTGASLGLSTAATIFYSDATHPQPV